MPILIGIAALVVLAGIYVVMSLSRFRESAGAMEQAVRELLTRLQKMESRLDETEERLNGSLACAVIAAMQGAQIIRVHDVKETVEALRVVEATLAAKGKKRYE